MEKKNYTIKDIARLAGVSAGTVDRVLHNRGDVSAASLEKVRKVLDEIDYRPNMFAIGLAAKKHYNILCMIPYPYNKGNDYWQAVTKGINRAAEELFPFNVTVRFLCYTTGIEASYAETCGLLRQYEFDAVLLAPNFNEATTGLATFLEHRGIPYVYVDVNVDQTNPLCYIGQDSRTSGYVSAKLLFEKSKPGASLALFINAPKEGGATEIQMQRRLEGFMRYVDEHHVEANIHRVVLDKEYPENNIPVLDAFFERHPEVELGVVFNSRVYQLADYLCLRGRRLQSLVGYDLLDSNVEYLRQGVVSYLIGQRPEQQGYWGVKTLANRIVFKQDSVPVKYMPIDILMKENIDFYAEFE